MAIDSVTSYASVVRSDRSDDVSAGKVAAQQKSDEQRQKAAADVQRDAPVAKQDARSVDQAVSELREFVQNVRRNLDFQVDDVTGRVIVKVIDANSNEVIRQIPSEEMLALAQRLTVLEDEKMRQANRDSIKGILIEISA